MSAAMKLGHARAASAVSARLPMAGDSAPKREKDDFYATPSWVTESFLRSAPDWPHHVWEPAAGEGHIAEVLRASGREVVAADLVSRAGYTPGGIDFLLEREALAPSIVTNPPFKLAVEFVQHALAIGVTDMAMLLKLSFLQGGARTPWLFASGLRRVFVVPKRITFIAAQGRVPYASNFVDGYGWFVWRRGWVGPVEIAPAVLEAGS